MEKPRRNIRHKSGKPAKNLQEKPKRRENRSEKVMLSLAILNQIKLFSYIANSQA